MKRASVVALAVGGGVIALAAVGAIVARRGGREVTFARDVAPIVWAKCAPCHRPGEPGPFSLLDYRDVAEHARQIEDVTRKKFMPPWKPVPGFATYANDRSLGPAEIETIRRWVASGAREGNPADAPPPPVWPRGWRLGTPDLVVRMPEPFTLPAEGDDVYRNIVIPAPAKGPHWVAAWEFRTEGSKTIHHAILNLDRRGWARRRDAEDAEPGYPGMDPGDVQAPDGFYLVWTPGKAPTPPSAGTAWRLDDSTDLVLQLHLQPSGRPESVQPTLGFCFTETAPTRPRITIKVGDPPIDIPPGESHHVISDAFDLAADVELLGLFPHAHYLARRMRAWAIAPGGARTWLLAIDDWDFAWQEEYTFAEPLRLPRGTRVHMEFTYDNSEANVRNPSRPPQRVVSGERSIDEMGNITLELAPSEPGGLEALRESKYRRQIGGNQGDARGHFNLANTLARRGQTAEAAAEYRIAISLDARLAPAHFNLGNLLFGAGRHAEAVAAFEGALRAQPAFPEAELNLGNVLQRTGDRAEAAAHYRRALAQRPGYREAHLALQALGPLVPVKSGD